MSFESDFRLSCYRDVDVINKEHEVYLVFDTDERELYIKKTMYQYNLDTYVILRENNFAGLPKIRELIEDGSKLIIIEEYIYGKTIDEILKTRRFSKMETINIITELCKILKPLHKFTPMIIHRDIKASNIIVTLNGDICLLDFNASKVYDSLKKRDTVLIGTEGVAAPEQYGFGQSDQRTDIYSIGILINKMLTGALPSEDKCRGRLGKVVTKCTSIDPGQRYRNVKELMIAMFPFGKIRSESMRIFWNLPGLRTGKKWHVFIAAMVLFIDIVLCIKPEVSLKSAANMGGEGFYRAEDILLSVSLLLYMFNFMQWRDHFPFAKKVNIYIEILRVVFGMFLILIGCIAIVMLAGKIL